MLRSNFRRNWWEKKNPSEGKSPFWRRLHSPSPLWPKRIQETTLELCPPHRHLRPRSSAVSSDKRTWLYDNCERLVCSSRVLSGLGCTSSQSAALRNMFVTHANCCVVSLQVSIISPQVFTIRAVKDFYQYHRESWDKNFPNSAG